MPPLGASTTGTIVTLTSQRKKGMVTLVFRATRPSRAMLKKSSHSSKVPQPKHLRPKRCRGRPRISDRIHSK